MVGACGQHSEGEKYRKRKKDERRNERCDSRLAEYKKRGEFHFAGVFGKWARVSLALKRWLLDVRKSESLFLAGEDLVVSYASFITIEAFVTMVRNERANKRMWDSVKKTKKMDEKDARRRLRKREIGAGMSTSKWQKDFYMSKGRRIFPSYFVRFDFVFHSQLTFWDAILSIWNVFTFFFFLIETIPFP